jgi:hypothetical protein
VIGAGLGWFCLLPPSMMVNRHHQGLKRLPSASVALLLGRQAVQILLRHALAGFDLLLDGGKLRGALCLFLG